MVAKKTTTVVPAVTVNMVLSVAMEMAIVAMDANQSSMDMAASTRCL